MQFRYMENRFNESIHSLNSLSATKAQRQYVKTDAILISCPNELLFALQKVLVLSSVFYYQYHWNKGKEIASHYTYFVFNKFMLFYSFESKNSPK